MPLSSNPYQRQYHARYVGNYPNVDYPRNIYIYIYLELPINTSLPMGFSSDTLWVIVSNNWIESWVPIPDSLGRQPHAGIKQSTLLHRVFLACKQATPPKDPAGVAAGVACKRQINTSATSLWSKLQNLNKHTILVTTRRLHTERNWWASNIRTTPTWTYMHRYARYARAP